VKTLPLQLLKEKGACAEQYAIITREWPGGVPLDGDRASLVARIAALGLDVSWAAENLLHPAAWEAYREARATATKAYNEARATATKAYNEATTAAQEAYREATAAAEKAYDEAIARAFIECLASLPEAS
jgi:hypothetical protein